MCVSVYVRVCACVCMWEVMGSLLLYFLFAFFTLVKVVERSFHGQPLRSISCLLPCMQVQVGRGLKPF